MLETLPEEIFLLVLEQIPQQRDLKQLCEVSKTLYGLVLPKLYEVIVLSSKSERHLEKIDVIPFFRGDSTSRLHHTKHVRISANFHRNLEERCIHFRDIEDQVRQDYDQEIDERMATRQTIFHTLGNDIVGLLQQLKYEGLKSFSWELGTCIPPQILGPIGCLPIMQKSLEDIALITGSECLYGEEDGAEIDLSQFKALQRISWIGLQHDSYMQALGIGLKKNSKHLTHLQLENVGSPDGGTEDEDSDNENANSGNRKKYLHNFFAREGLGLKRSTVSTEAMFPALTSLSLAFISLKNAEKALIQALNIYGLSHLALRQCSAMEDFLREITASGHRLKLLSLEYNTGLDHDNNDHEVLQDITRLSPDLTDLFLSIAGPIMTLQFWRTLADIRVPLTRFVYHQRVWSGGDEGEEQDLSDLSLLPDNIDELEKAGEQHPFAQMNLKCLGLGADSYTLKSILASTSASNSLKLLHMRKSGSDMAGGLEHRSNMFSRWDTMSDEDNEDNEDNEDDNDEENDDDMENNYDGAATTAVYDSDYSTDQSVFDDPSTLPQDLLQFAHWAFGVDGIPSLQVLAYGDFSFKHRFVLHNHILCRQTRKIPKQKIDLDDNILTFRPIRNSDMEMLELVNENMDFLEACPVDFIIMPTDY